MWRKLLLQKYKVCEIFAILFWSNSNAITPTAREEGSDGREDSEKEKQTTKNKEIKKEKIEGIKKIENYLQDHHHH